MEQKIEIYESFPGAKLDAEYWATKGWFIHTMVGYDDGHTAEHGSPNVFVVYRKSKKG